MCKPSFRQAVNQSNNLQGCCQAGLQALGNNSNKVKVDDTRHLQGSVALDECLKQVKPYSTEHRWDYLVGYQEGCLFCVEVHGDKPKEVLAKKAWLDRWLRGAGFPLRRWARSIMYYWIPTGQVSKAWNAKGTALSTQGIIVTRQAKIQCKP